MLLIPGTGNGSLRPTVYSGNPIENSKWWTKQKKRLEEEQFVYKREFLPAVPPNGQYVLSRAESD